jgi:uncharacterized protein (DUF3084 family)
MLSKLKDLLAGLIPGGTAVTAIWNFVTSTVGMVLIASTIAFVTGYHLRAEKAELDDLRHQVLVLKTDNELSENARKLVERQSASLEAKLKSNQGRVAALQADLAKRAPARKACGLTEDDARKLREIQ